MTGPVLAACQGSAPAVRRLAVLLARTLDAELVVVTAYRYEPVALTAAAEPARDQDRRLQAAERTLDRVLDHLPADVRSSGRVVPAVGIADALLDAASELDASVLVVGPDERGHVTDAVLRRARCPVAVAPTDPLLVGDRLGSVAVGFDGSPCSALAATAAARLGRAAGVPVTLVGVIATPGDRALLERAAAGPLALDGQEMRLALHTGTPSAELRRAAEAFDLLACGSRGRGRLTGALLGSVSRHLVTAPPCATLVVGPHVRRDAAGPLGLTGGAG